MQNFGRITSGLVAAQTGLYTTGHNIANVSTPGYTRQRANFADGAYGIVGYNQGVAMKVGLGTKLIATTQIRDSFLDKTYRQASSKASFYNAKLDAINEIEYIMGELYGDARLSKNIDEMWSALQALSTHPDGIETRSMFVQAAIRFVTKTDEIANGLYDYQVTINNQIIKGVNRINEITTQIQELNERIVYAESCGDNANDYRDTRNNLIDELSTYGDVHTKEDSYGRFTVLMEGKDLVSNGRAVLLGLQYVSDEGYPFVEPIFSRDYVEDGQIVPFGAHTNKLFTDLESGPIGGRKDNDNGSLKAMLLVRGKYPANHTTADSVVENYTIPTFQKELDKLINSIVTLINDTLAPQTEPSPPDVAPTGLQGEQYVELFSRKYVERYTGGNPPTGTYNSENAADRKSLYTMGNLQVNPDVLNNFNCLCLSYTEDRAETTVIQELLGAWKGDSGSYLPQFIGSNTPMQFDAYYRELLARVGEEGSTAKIYVESQEFIVNDAISARSSLSGVAIDEELTEMIKFQHAYDAAAKMINVIDSMMDVVVNKLKA